MLCISYWRKIKYDPIPPAIKQRIAAFHLKSFVSNRNLRYGCFRIYCLVWDAIDEGSNVVLDTWNMEQVDCSSFPFAHFFCLSSINRTIVQNGRGKLMELFPKFLMHMTKYFFKLSSFKARKALYVPSILRAFPLKIISNGKANINDFYYKQIDAWVMFDWLWFDLLSLDALACLFVCCCFKVNWIVNISRTQIVVENLLLRKLSFVNQNCYPVLWRFEVCPSLSRRKLNAVIAKPSFGDRACDLWSRERARYTKEHDIARHNGDISLHWT